MTKPFFRTKDGRPISSVTPNELDVLWSALINDYGLSASQLVESASYSMAMVARFALGQSADDGKVVTLAADRVSGWVAVATMRHLVTAGADGVIIVEEPAAPNTELARQLFTMERLGIPIVTLAEVLANDPNLLIENCHTVLCGLYERGKAPSAAVNQLVGFLNEAATPVHAVEAPIGINPEKGSPLEVPLYASSTMALAAPLTGLHAGRDFVGRLYLADASCPSALYQQFGIDMTKAFAEQPVVQITPFD